MNDSNWPEGPRTVASFPDPAVNRAVIQSIRNLCGIMKDGFWELTDTERLQKLVDTRAPLVDVPCQQALSQAINVAYAIVMWASRETGTPEADIVEIISRDFPKG